MANPTVNSSDNIPTYLFRLHAPRTVGKTTTTRVTPPAWDRGSAVNRDLFRLPPEEAARWLNDHLRWEPEHQEQCNLMSWSSSLLFVLQYGLYRYRTDYDKPSLSNIHLFVLDTRHFSKGTFIRDMDAIETFQKYSLDLAKLKTLRTPDKYFGEYLTQGCLDIEGQCSQTSMKQLIDMGLFTLCPALGKTSNWNKWVNPVLAIRKGFDSPAGDTDKKNVHIAISMAQACFGTGWALPLAAMLLSLTHRQYDDGTILSGFCSMFTDDEIASLNPQEMKFGLEYGRLPELKQCRDMMKAIYCHGADTDVDELLNPLAKLSIEHHIGLPKK